MGWTACCIAKLMALLQWVMLTKVLPLVLQLDGLIATQPSRPSNFVDGSRKATADACNRGQ